VTRFEITVSDDARRSTDDRAFQTDFGPARDPRGAGGPERAYQTDGAISPGDRYANGAIAPLAG
jgi:hypothetical protein